MPECCGVLKNNAPVCAKTAREQRSPAIETVEFATLNYIKYNSNIDDPERKNQVDTFVYKY